MTFPFLRIRPLRVLGAFLVLLLGLSLGAAEARAQLQVGEVYPAPFSTTAATTDSIVVRLTTLETIVVAAGNGDVRITSATRGPLSFTSRLDNTGPTTEFVFFPDEPFAGGDQITVLLEQDFTQNQGGETLAQPFTWTFRVRPQVGTGMFTDASGLNPGPEVVDLGEGPLNLNGVAAGDFTGDGYPDLAIASEARRVVTILTNTRLRGSGLFQNTGASRMDVDVVATVSNVAAGDLDGDGDLDVAATHNLTNQISLLFNQGDGTFTTTVFDVSESRPTRIRIADLDGDGNNDIVTVAFGSDVVALRRGTGGGAFAAEQTVSVGAAPNDVAVIDIDRDGLLDLVVSAAGTRTVELLINQGGGTFAPGGQIDLDFTPSGIAIGDVFGAQTVGGVSTNDGLLDLVVVGQDTPVLRTYGQRAGEPLVFDRTSGAADPEQPSAFALMLADVDVTDSDLDAISTGLSDGRLVVRRANVGTGQFDAPEFYDAGVAPRGLAIADFDLDGDVDVATVVDLSGNALLLYFNEGGLMVDNGVTVAPNPLEFGEVPLCAGGTVMLTLTNTSGVPADIRGLTFSDPIFSTTQAVPFTIQPGASADVPITLVPGEQVGGITGSLSVDAEFGGTTSQQIIVQMTGEGVGAILTAVPAALDFEDTETSTSLTLEAVVTNTGNRAAPITSITTSNGVFTAGGSAPLTLAPGESVTIPVTFTPTDQTDYAESLLIAGDAAVVCPPLTTVALTGSGFFPLPDLVPTVITLATNDPLGGGQRRGVVLSIDNRSDAPVNAPFRVTLARNGTVVLDSTITTLAGNATIGIETDVLFDATGQTTLTLTADAGDAISETDETNNVLTLDLNVLGPADLTPNTLTLEGGIAVVREGDERLVQARFVNQGGIPAVGPFRLVLSAIGSTGTVTVLRDSTLQRLGVGNSVSLNATYAFPGPDDAFTLRAEADPDGAVPETNETNNVRELTFRVRPLMPDLVAEIEGPSTVAAGGSAFYVPTITNRFEAVPGPITAQFSQDGLVLIDTVIAQGLDVDETLRLNRTRVDFPIAGSSTLRLIVDAPNSGPEDDDTNNFDELIVDVTRSNRFEVRPNPFTPNGDGFNDIAEFDFAPLGPVAPRLRIMNFEGRQIFDRQASGSPIIRWDGRDDQGRDLEPGVYMYVVEDDDGTFLASGAIYLAR